MSAEPGGQNETIADHAASRLRHGPGDLEAGMPRFSFWRLTWKAFSLKASKVDVDSEMSGPLLCIYDVDMIGGTITTKVFEETFF